MHKQEVTITSSSKVQLAFLGGIVASVAGVTGYIVSVKNDVEVHERRLTAIELRQDQQDSQLVDVLTRMTRIETKLDILINNNIVKKE
jgi:hypothetical protein